MSFLSHAFGRFRRPGRGRPIPAAPPAPVPVPEVPARPAPAQVPEDPAPDGLLAFIEYPPPAMLASFLNIARERFLEPGSHSFHSLMIASDLTAAQLSVEECAQLLMAVTDDVRGQVFERAGWYWPSVPGSHQWQHFLRCLASLALECCLRQEESLIELERQACETRSLVAPCRLLPDVSRGKPRG